MNVFRLAGDLCHVLSIIILLLRLRVTQNAAGISVKTQELYLMVFCARYLDLFTTYYGLYNSIMKILYIASTSYIVYLVRFTEPFKSTYDKTLDSFRSIFLLAPCCLVALVTSYLQGFDLIECLWDFSVYLEAIAIVPQLTMLHRQGEVENLTGNYVFFLGIYRALYIVNWVYRSYFEPLYKHNYVVYGAGVLQTLLYIDFIYYFIQNKYRGGKLNLPK